MDQDDRQHMLRQRASKHTHRINFLSGKLNTLIFFSCLAMMGGVCAGVALLLSALLPPRLAARIGALVSARPTAMSFFPSGVMARSITREGELESKPMTLPARSCVEWR